MAKKMAHKGGLRVKGFEGMEKRKKAAKKGPKKGTHKRTSHK
jgi:hypothetical protein